jgi:hypothetical protein
MNPFGPSLSALALALTLTASVSADTYHHIDELALSIDRESKRLLQETRHYRHTPEYGHLVNDCRELSRLADHMHDVAHHHGSLSHLECDLRELDSMFHHLESLFDQIEWRAAHGHGHVHGHTGHVRQLLDSIEQSIHHLQDDVRQLRQPVHPIIDRPIHVSPHSGHWGGYDPYWRGGSSRYRSSGFGISIGGGHSRFTLRF